MNAENFQHKLSRIRPPRVQITYDVHIGNAIEKKELPLVVGVLADLAGSKDDNKTFPVYSKRGFVDIDRDNFDLVMGNIGPAVSVPLRLPAGNLMTGAATSGDLPITLAFSRLDHFQPIQILKRAVASDGQLPLRHLLERRHHLADLVTKLQGNDKLRAALLKALAEPDKGFGGTVESLKTLTAQPPAPTLTLEPSLFEQPNGTAEFSQSVKIKLTEGKFDAPPEVTVAGIEGVETSPVVVISPKLAELTLTFPKGTDVGKGAIRFTLAGEVLEAAFELKPVQPAAGGAEQPAAGGAVQPAAGGAVQPAAGGAVQPAAGGAEQPAAGGAVQLQGRDALLQNATLKAILEETRLAQTEEKVSLRYAIELARTFVQDVAVSTRYTSTHGVIPLSRDHENKLIEAKTDEEREGISKPTGDDIDLTWLLQHNRIPAFDREIASYLNQILHNENFQKLEASWRGLNHLVMNTETGELLKIRLLCASRDEVFNDLDKALEPDQSLLFKKVYEAEYGTFGGDPFSLLIGDYYFDRKPKDIECLANIASVAAAAHAPFISAADPGLFDLESWQDLAVPRDLSKIFQSPAMIKWNSFRQSEDARYVALTLPRYLLRGPYGKRGKPAEDLPDFNEESSNDRSGHKNFLWGNAAYALGQRITAAFAQFRWTAAIRGVEGGGLVRNLPVVLFSADGGLVVKPPTEVLITDRREKELSDLGFISLCYKKVSDQAAFFGGQTVNRPILYNTDEANANSRLSARLPYVLAMSRFAHYFKVMMRDKIGSFMTKENVAAYLNTWIADYVLLNDDAPQALKASNPLREARVDVFDVAGKPGVYQAVAFLRPHFQLEELSVSMRIVASLPPPALTLPAPAPLLA